MPPKGTVHKVRKPHNGKEPTTQADQQGDLDMHDENSDNDNNSENTEDTSENDNDDDTEEDKETQRIRRRLHLEDNRKWRRLRAVAVLADDIDTEDDFWRWAEINQDRVGALLAADEEAELNGAEYMEAFCIIWNAPRYNGTKDAPIFVNRICNSKVEHGCVFKTPEGQEVLKMALDNVRQLQNVNMVLHRHPQSAPLLKAAIEECGEGMKNVLTHVRNGKFNMEQTNDIKRYLGMIRMWRET